MRTDGRDHDEIRPIQIRYERLDRVDGSARFSFGTISALASLSGPIEVRPQSELPSTATFELNLRPLAGLPSPSSKALASSLRSALSPSLLLANHPRSLIQVVIQSLSAGLPPASPHASGLSAAALDARAYHPALVAASLNAATAALVNAGSVSMRGVVLAAAVGRLRAPGPMKSVDLVLDPSEEEHARIEGGGCFAFLFGGPAAFGPESETGSDGAERGKEQDDVPAAALVWSNYGTWQAASGVDIVPSSKEELLEARKLALIGARAVWRALKESVPSMDGPRIQPKYSLPQPTPRRAAAVAIPPTAVGDGEMDDEIEEVEDDDARMEI